MPIYTYNTFSQLTPLYHRQQQSRNCYHGGNTSVCTHDSSAAFNYGGVRTTAPPPVSNYSFGTGGASIDDSAWEIVDAPHDFVILYGGISPDADWKHGYINRNVSWYRKHFLLPPAWQGQSIWLEFEGAFHYTQIWLNGQYIFAHPR